MGLAGGHLESHRGPHLASGPLQNHVFGTWHIRGLLGIYNNQDLPQMYCQWAVHSGSTDVISKFYFSIISVPQPNNSSKVWSRVLNTLGCPRIWLGFSQIHILIATLWGWDLFFPFKEQSPGAHGLGISWTQVQHWVQVQTEVKCCTCQTTQTLSTCN